MGAQPLLKQTETLSNGRAHLQAGIPVATVGSHNLALSRCMARPFSAPNRHA